VSKASRHLGAVVEAIESVTGVTVKSVSRGKHLKFVCDTPVGERMIVTSITPSDRRAIKNIVQDVKRCINQPRGKSK
jgi:hypothetical protein